MSETSIRWERDDAGVVTLTLDDPHGSANTMNDLFVRSLRATADRLEAERESVTGVIVTSAKKTYFAGGDLNSLVKAGPEDRAGTLERVGGIKADLRRIETLGVPVVAAINGTALGGGLEITLACHHRVVLADPRLRLGFPEVTLGLLPGGGGVVRSVRLLGLTTALTEMLLQGQQLRPDRALELGLVDEVVDSPAELLERARAFVTANPRSLQRFDAPKYRVPGGTPASPSLAAMLPVFPATLVKQLKGAHLPAPHHILCAAVESLLVDVDTAMTIEARYFVDLVVGRTSTNMIQAFWFDLNRINGGGSRPDGFERRVPERVAVLGAGMMGAGIAHVVAKAGIDVVLKDVDTAAAQRGKDRVAAILEKAVSRGRSTPEKRDALLARITPAGDAAEVAGCDAVIEAVFEDPALKHRVFGEVQGGLTPDALLCSNTSTLPITGLAEGVDRPEDFIGLHFFSPVEKMPLVEIIVGERTSDATLARAYDLVRAIGKTPIVVNDSRGFFTSRVFGTLVMEGAAMLGEGMPPMSVERAALQAGFPAGPLTLLDEVTLTLPLKIRDAEVASGGAGPEHPGVAVMRAVVEAGRTGKSAGAGFFDWEPEKRVWPGLAGLWAQDPDAVPVREAQERMLFAMAVETARCVEEGVLRAVEDANIGSIMGIGFPPQYGGVLQYVDQYEGGVAGFVARANELADRHGERFRPPALLVKATGTLREAVSARP